MLGYLCCGLDWEVFRTAVKHAALLIRVSQNSIPQRQLPRVERPVTSLALSQRHPLL